MSVPTLIAHRAGNSLDTARSAVDRGADIIELDVHLTRDHRLLVQSDPEVPTESGPVYISQLNWNRVNRERRHLNLGEAVELKDALAWAQDLEAGVMIDIKNGPVFYRGIEQAIAETLWESTIRGEILVVSYDHRCIQLLAQLGAPPLRLGILFRGRLANLAETIDCVGADLVCVDNRFLTIDVMDSASSKEARVCTALASHPRAVDEFISGNHSVDYVTAETKTIEFIRSRLG